MSPPSPFGQQATSQGEICVAEYSNMSYLLRLPLVCPLVLVVDAREVGDDDGDGQRDDEHARQRADAADQLAQRGLGHHVAVTAKERPRCYEVA